MTRWFSMFLFVGLLGTPILAFAEDDARPAAEERESPIDDDDLKELRKAYASLSGKIAVIETELKGLTKFKGKDKDLVEALKRLKSATQEARTAAGTVAELSKPMEWSKAPKIAARIAGECDTLDSVADSLASKDDITTSVKNELKASGRSLKKDVKKLGSTPPVAAK